MIDCLDRADAQITGFPLAKLMFDSRRPDTYYSRSVALFIFLILGYGVTGPVIDVYALTTWYISDNFYVKSILSNLD